MGLRKEKMEKMLGRKGQAIADQASTFVGFAILIVVGIIVFSSFDSASTSISTTTAGTASLANATSQTYSAFNIVSISPIVLAAVIVLAVVAFLGGGKR